MRASIHASSDIQTQEHNVWADEDRAATLDSNFKLQTNPLWEKMVQKDNQSKSSVTKIVVDLKGADAKTKWLAVNHQSQVALTLTLSQLSWTVVSQLLVSDWVSFSRCERCCEKMVAEAGDSSGTEKKGECPTLEAVTKQRLVKTWLWALVWLCNSELESVVTRYIKKFNKSGHQSKTSW
jgi:hypothetical protein